MQCGAHHPGYNRGWTPCCHSSRNKRCPDCGCPGCHCACSSTASCSPAPPPPDDWCWTAVSERWKTTRTNEQRQTVLFPVSVAMTLTPWALSRDVHYLPAGLASSLVSSGHHAAPSGSRAPLECKDNQGWCLLALLPSCRKWWASQCSILKAPSSLHLGSIRTWLDGLCLSFS